MMSQVITWIQDLNWSMVFFLCLTLGLAPFAPPHIVEKIGMLIKGTLKRPLDWFDLFLHASPWVLLLIKIAVSFRFGLKGM